MEMDHKPSYESQVKKPLTFEEWKGNLAPQFSDEKMKSFNRLYNVDYKKEFEEMLQREYQEYCSTLTGDWLFK